MKYTVHWTPSAEQELADIWMNAADRAAVTSASHTIDRLLAWNPDKRGAARFDTVRTLTVPPLGVDFEVVDQDLIVWVLSAWDTTKAPPP
jgi:hypothetical protein